MPYGVRTNPKKSERVTLSSGAKVTRSMARLQVVPRSSMKGGLHGFALVTLYVYSGDAPH
jgi:hypothetical protein